MPKFNREKILTLRRKFSFCVRPFDQPVVEKEVFPTIFQI